MPRQRIIVVPSMVRYVPPRGWRVAFYVQLANGSYEVTLEPWALIS